MKWRDITNPPKLLYIEGKEWNGILGYYCMNDIYTYCMGDNQKIVSIRPVLAACHVAVAKPFLASVMTTVKDFRQCNITSCYRLLYQNKAC